MPASSQRVRQPVTEVANELGALLKISVFSNKIPVFSNMPIKAKNGKSLKDLNTKDEKIDAIGNSFSVNDEISNDGRWNVLVVDDLFHTGHQWRQPARCCGHTVKLGNLCSCVDLEIVNEH
jgi:hypothetical protein